MMNKYNKYNKYNKHKGTDFSEFLTWRRITLFFSQKNFTQWAHGHTFEVAFTHISFFLLFILFYFILFCFPQWAHGQTFVVTSSHEHGWEKPPSGAAQGICVCMMCVFICVYVCMYVCIYICTRVQRLLLLMCSHAYTSVRAHTLRLLLLMCSCIYICTRAHTTHVCTYIHTHNVCVYIYERTHTMYVCIYTSILARTHNVCVYVYTLIKGGRDKSSSGAALVPVSVCTYGYNICTHTNTSMYIYAHTGVRSWAASGRCAPRANAGCGSSSVGAKAGMYVSSSSYDMYPPPHMTCILLLICRERRQVCMYMYYVCICIVCNYRYVCIC